MVVGTEAAATLGTTAAVAVHTAARVGIESEVAVGTEAARGCGGMQSTVSGKGARIASAAKKVGTVRGADLQAG